MKRIALTTLTLLAVATASGEYTVKVPIETNQGGSLQNGSIIFINNQDDINNQNEIVKALDCINNPTEDLEECEKRLTAWESFADESGLSKNWNNLNWGYKNLTELPEAPYPLSTVNELYLHVNNLSSVESLMSITNIFSLDIRENQLTNLDWLSNLTYAGVIAIWNNSTPLTNINGLRNVEIGITIRLDPYSGPKLPANSRFCTLNDESKFYSGMATKSELCEAQ